MTPSSIGSGMETIGCTQDWKRKCRKSAATAPVDDSEVLAMAQRGFKTAEEGGAATVQMGTGGRETGNEGHMATESAIRGLYQYYREVMGL